MLRVFLPPTYPKAPQTGELVNGLVLAATQFTWPDLAYWLGSSAEVPADYPDELL